MGLVSDQNRWLQIYANCLVFGILSLIFLGALVKSHEAGLSVPDWPQSFGYNMFLFPYSHWVGGIFYEHSHRLLASVVGLFTVGLAVWLQLAKVSRQMKLAGYVAVGVVVLQGILGGLTVLLRLPDLVSIAHGVLAQSFLLLITGVVFFLRYRVGRPSGSLSRVDRLGLVALGVVFVQLVLGALMRHAEAGLAILDFPTVAGQWIPVVGDSTLARVNEERLILGLGAVDTFQVITHLMHRYWAFVVALVVGVYAYVVMEQGGSYRRLGTVLLLLLAVQFLLGIITIFSLRQPWLTSLHVVTGALMLATAFWCFLSGRYLAKV